MDKWELLTLLKAKENEYISGEDISKKFNVTRTAIWKNINELKMLGYEITSKTNNGYKLLSPFDIFNAYELEYKFAEKSLPYKVIFMDIVDSTSSEAKRRHIPNSDDAVIVALEQIGGRGRYNRSFLSKPNLGIYFTIKINSSREKLISTDDITFYPLVAALSVNSAIKKICGVDLKLKWPNDLLYNEKKICGILTEASIEAETRDVAYVIVGIGININHSISDFSDDIKEKAISIKMITGENCDRTELLSETVACFTNFLSMLHDELLTEYRKYLITDRKVSFSQNNINYIGTIHDINNNGNLIVTLEDNTTMTIQSGEVNLIF